MKMFKPVTLAVMAASLALTGCVTNAAGEQQASKTAVYGLGGAAVCGIIGALTHGGKGARNSALACGAVGAGIGGYMDYQEHKLRESLANTGVDVQREGNQIKLVMPDSITFATNSAALSTDEKEEQDKDAQTQEKKHESTLTVEGKSDNNGTELYLIQI